MLFKFHFPRLVLASSIVAMGFAVADSAGAAPVCTPGSFASYVALGSGGCTVGIATYYNFAYPTPTSSGGEFSLASSWDIQVTPGMTIAGQPELSFSSPSFFSLTSEGSAEINYFLNYTEDPPIILPGASERGDPFVGGATGLENICIGGTFVSGVCPTTETTLTVTPDSPMDSTTFLTNLIDVQTTISLQSADGNTASIDSLTETTMTGAVPEPGATLLTSLGGIGLLGLGAARRRRASLRKAPRTL